MKVIKKGNGRTGWSKELECTGKGNDDTGCGAILLVEEDDLYITKSYARDEVDTYVTFRCMECQSETDVNGVPHKVRERLKQ